MTACLRSIAVLLFCAFAFEPALADFVEKRAKQTPACEEGVSLLETLDAQERTTIEAEAAAVPNGEGRLFRIEREGVAPSFLFGTMHLSDPRVLDIAGPAEDAFAEAGTLVVETVDLADENAVAAALLMRSDLINLPRGTQLLDLVPEDRRTMLEEALGEAGVPAGSVGTLQPWFVTVALAMPPCEVARQAEGLDVLDLALMRRAEAGGMAVEGLESSAEQMEALASLPFDLQAENLVAVLELKDRLPDVFETMVGLYLDGRIGAIAPTIERIAPSGTDAASSAAVYTAFEEAVVTKRNILMAERAGPILERGGAFVAVGALHLPGEEGLVELLRSEGWQVERAD